MSGENFELAAKQIKKYFKDGKDTSDDNKLALYKYFQQGSIGDCNIERPGGFNPFSEANAEWDAWNSVKGLSQTDAKEEYVKLAISILPLEKGAKLNMQKQLINKEVPDIKNYQPELQEKYLDIFMRNQDMKSQTFTKGLGISFTYEELYSFINSPYRMHIKIMIQMLAYLSTLKSLSKKDNGWAFWLGKTGDMKLNKEELMKRLVTPDEVSELSPPVSQKNQKNKKFVMIIQFDFKYVPILIFPLQKLGFVVDYNNQDKSAALKAGGFAFNILQSQYGLFTNLKAEDIEFKTITLFMDKQVSDCSVSCFHFLYKSLITQNITDASGYQFQSYELENKQRGEYKKIIQWLIFELRNTQKIQEKEQPASISEVSEQEVQKRQDSIKREDWFYKQDDNDSQSQYIKNLMSKLEDLNLYLEKDPRDLKKLQITLPELQDQIMIL